VFRNADDSGEIVVLLEWDSLDDARDFMNQPELARDMNRAGVIEKPQIVFLEELDAAQLGGNG
jgi:hypothetical protein